MESGQELVEFALILPLLVLILLGIFEFGIAGFTYNTVANAAREVARYGVIHPNQSEIDLYIDENLPRWTIGMHADDIEVISEVKRGAIQGTVHITMTYQHHLISGPLLEMLGGKSVLKLRTTSTMYTETTPD
jgi:hypothetical protein